MHIVRNPADVIKYQKCHLLIKLILELNEMNEFKTDEKIWFQLNDDLFSKDILWYPSSSVDVTDILYVDNEIFSEFNKDNPGIFIHSDFSGFYVIETHLHTFFQTNQIEIIKETRIQSNSNHIKLYQLKIENKIVWLIYFYNNNEYILEALLRYKICIKFIYSVCDGIADGMGGNNYEIRIPTKFYSFFYKALETKFHISKYHNWSQTAVDDHLIHTINNLIHETGRQNEFNINQIEAIENSYKNPINVYERFQNFGNTGELWLREC